MSVRVLLIMAPHEVGFMPPGILTLLPLGFGVLSGSLRRQGIEVDLLDMGAELVASQAHGFDKSYVASVFDKEATLQGIRSGIQDEKLLKVIERMLGGRDLNSYQVVGVSCGGDFSLFQSHIGFLIGRYIKDRSSARVMFGGSNIQYLYYFREFFQEFWQAVLGQFEYVIRGPGQVAMHRVCTGAEAPDRRNLPGRVYLNAEGKVESVPEVSQTVETPDWTGLDMSHYVSHLRPNPDASPTVEGFNVASVYSWPHHLFQYVNRLRARGLEGETDPTVVVPYAFSYNCPFNCTFCDQSDIDKQKTLRAPIPDVLKALEELKSTYKTRFFAFYNNYFNINTKYADELCRLMIERKLGIYWSDCARFNGLSPERLALMKEAGCRRLIFGFESGSPRILERIDKRIQLDQAEKVLRWCKEAGISADLEVILGLPYELDEDFQATQDFITRNSANINYLHVNAYFVVPASLLGRYPEKYGIEIAGINWTYEEILKKNRDAFEAGNYEGNFNFQVLRYNEKGGRAWEEIRAATQGRLKTMNAQQRRKHSDVMFFYSLLDKGARQRKPEAVAV